MVAKAFKLGAIGCLLGMIAGVLILVVEGFVVGGGELVLPKRLIAATGSESGALLAHMLISGLFGAVPWAGIVIYEIDSWGLLKQAVVHYVSYTVAFLVIGVCAGWFEPTFTDLAPMAGVFLVCHCIIWFIMYTRYKAETDELNVLLQNAKQGA